MPESHASMETVASPAGGISSRKDEMKDACLTEASTAVGAGVGYQVADCYYKFGGKL